MKKLFLLVVLISTCLLICSSYFAAAAAEDEYLPSYNGPEEPERISLVPMLGRLFFSLLAVIALFYLLAKYLKSRWAGMAATEHMAVLDRLSLGVNKDVYIIRLGNEYLVLGVTGENISLLQKVKEPALLAQLQIQQKIGENTFDKLLSHHNETKFLSLSSLEARLAKIKNFKETEERLSPGEEKDK